MPLHTELGLGKPFSHKAHEAALNIVFTASRLTKEGNRILQPFGITDAQFNVLMLLKDHAESGPITQTDLGRMLLVNRSNVTGLVDRMEQAGLIRRTPVPGDRRVNHVEMTERGRTVLKEAHDAYYRRLEKLMGVFSGDDYECICRLLERIRSQIPG